MKKIHALVLLMFLIACSPTPQSAPAPFTAPITEAPVSTSNSTPVTITPLPKIISPITPTLVEERPAKIAFTSEQDGDQKIYVVNTDGSNLIELVRDISSKLDPVWSPDGSKVSFGSNNAKSASLYIMDADGSNLNKVLDTSDYHLYDQSNPDVRFANDCCSMLWSPDSVKIIFKASYHVGCCYSNAHVYILNLNNDQLFTFRIASWGGMFWSPDSKKFGIEGTEDCGKFRSCIIDAENSKPIDLAIDIWPGGGLAWSPDATKIAFQSNWKSKNSNIYVMNADGSNPVNLSQHLANGQNGGLVWSTNSKQIAFSSCDYSLCELYITNTDGSNLIRLTTQTIGLSNVVWSNDSEKIIYVSADNGNSDIYVVNSDGSNTVNMTNNSAEDNSPILSPDGTKIAFVSNRDGNNEIYIMDIGDNSLFRLTNNEANDFSPIWLP